MRLRIALAVGLLPVLFLCGGVMLGVSVLAAVAQPTSHATPRGPSEPLVTKAMTNQPSEGQFRPPCPVRSVAKEGSCWVPFRDETGKQVRGCLDDEILYQDKDGLCWTPARPVNKKVPRAVDPHSAP